MKRAAWLIVPWALFTLAALGWVGYWHVVANTAEARVRTLLAEQNAAGAEALVGEIARRGFPRLLWLELNDVAYASERGGWSATTARANLHVNLLNPQHVTLQAQAPIAIARADGAVTNISADALIASLRTDGDALAVAGVEADNLRLDDPARDGVLGIGKLVLNLRPDPREPGEYQLAFDAEALTLPQPVRSFEAFGQEIAALRAAIVVEQGASLISPAPQDPLGPWREAGGRLRLEALSLTWGPLEARGEGDGGLDDQRRLTGRLELPIDQPAPVLNALAQSPGADDSARRGLQLLAAGYALSGDDITLDVLARDGLLRLEGLPVRALPPVY